MYYYLFFQVLKKLEKKKIPLDKSGENFMAMSIGDQVKKYSCNPKNG
jgi:hypothetical protein